MSVSLKNPAGNQDEKKPEIVKQSQLNIVTPFSQSDLHEAWKRYAETLREKLHLKNTMLNNLPALKENYRIEAQVYNPQQEQALKEEIISLVEFLRKELKNTSIVIDVFITEENTKKLAYTDKEKFELMASKNEILGSLVKEFNLRLD